MWRDDALILDIVIAASDAMSFVRNIDWPIFEQSRLHQNAVIRSIEIIGEAANGLSSLCKDNHRNPPWREMIAMRHRLVHAYDAVRLDIVRRVVQDDLPTLVATLGPLVPPA